MQPSFCLIQKLKRSSAENSRRPKTLAIELSLSLLSLSYAPSLSPHRRTLSLSSPAPCGGGGDRVSTFSYPCSRSRSRLRWSVLNPSCSHKAVDMNKEVPSSDEDQFSLDAKDSNVEDEVVAIKELDRNDAQGIREFVVEVTTRSLINHPNLVKLIGFCAQVFRGY
ncbi:hypothetical protein F2Q70_00026415 [Brassica cretica]|uniref:Serine-threonine/tyrosine-protein kinase catalytic domain-containing protein n=1 Tax=Brassica cretica TaxID=69181 RepID=A0A8S9L8X6_BRACR|nr:hypothetical protein F2Q70_00026415 [Brassica cretica]